MCRRLLSRTIAEFRFQGSLNEFTSVFILTFFQDSMSLSKEATEYMILAGRRFRAVLGLNPGDERALVNWGQALCMRAKLAAPTVSRLPRSS